MKPPLTNEQEVLYTLIKKGYVTFKDFAYLPGFRTRVSQLKSNLQKLCSTSKPTYRAFCECFGRQTVIHNIYNKYKNSNILF